MQVKGRFTQNQVNLSKYAPGEVKALDMNSKSDQEVWLAWVRVPPLPNFSCVKKFEIT